MMELRHLAMVNWHLFDVEDIEVSGHMGVLGENRSGKSTILDMAQVVLTGGNRHFQRLNAVAGDGGKGRSASKRSVAEYCLGALGEDQRRRDEARTYIALGFEDTEGRRPPVTIGMAIEARKSESNETVLARFVAVGKILKANDFIELRAGRRFPAQWDEVRNRIVAAVGEESFANHRDKAGDYVREYMRHLLPHASHGEQTATSLQKAIVNAMTLDHNQTATQFVRDFILEKNAIRVGELRESIQTYRNINATIQKMRQKLDALKALRAILGELEDALERKFREQWIAKRADWLAAHAANRELRDKLQIERRQSDAAKDELTFLDEEIRGIEKEIERLNVAIAEHDAKTGKQGLLLVSRGAEQAASRAAADFRKRMEAIRYLQPLCAMERRGFDDGLAALQTLAAAATNARVDHLPDGLANAEAAVLSAGPELLKTIDAARQSLFRDAAERRDLRERTRDRIRQHASGQSGAHLDESTERLCRKLRQSGMAPRVLCDLVDVAEAEWTGAAEALLGRDREAVLVDRSDIVAATAIFKEGRRDFRGAALVSLNKLEPFRTPPQPGTFPSIFVSEDQDALSFIMRRYGTVRLANTLGEFDAPGRAIMQDGLYDDGLVRSHRAVDPTRYKIGKSAQAKALRDLEAQAEELEESIAEAERTATAVDAAHRALRSLCDDPDSALPALAAAYAAAQAEKADAQERINALEGAGDGGLRDKRTAQFALKSTRAAERKTQDHAFHKHDKEATVVKRKLADNENVPGSTLNLQSVWSIFKKGLALYDRAKGRAAYRTRLDVSAQKNEAERHRTIATKATTEVGKAQSDWTGAESRVRDALRTYFDTFGVSSQIGTDSEPLKEVKPWMEQLIQDIESNELRRYERQAREAADKAATLLRGEFINALTSRINKMERELQSMNRSLQDHPFHNERYSFHRTQVAEFQPVLKIMEIGKTSPEALDMLFSGNVPDDFPHKDTIAALEALLEDPEKDFAQFEDYRNFYTFEIHMQDVATGRTTRWETRRGTGSGAEQQVPIYVAIGASLASVYGHAERRTGKPSGMALAIFDEAFSKMDGKNQRQMMSFYKNLGLQIVIAAPFEKRVTVLEHMETIVEVDRIGEQGRATVVKLKARARQELMAIDPDLMSNADIATRIAAE